MVGKRLCRFCLFCNGFYDVKWIVDKPDDLPKGVEPGIASHTCHAQLPAWFCSTRLCSMMTAYCYDTNIYCDYIAIRWHKVKLMQWLSAASTAAQGN